MPLFNGRAELLYRGLPLEENELFFANSPLDALDSIERLMKRRYPFDELLIVEVQQFVPRRIEADGTWEKVPPTTVTKRIVATRRDSSYCG